ncbi:cellulose binding domain-containing protein [Micromonospora sp. NPDC000207]|uniref:cellulose binding domain-containing protein n=1 Tax=Micromonospora sp. NPDC000207 TaxID=3154246 RepID=UPI00331E69F5
MASSPWIVVSVGVVVMVVLFGVASWSGQGRGPDGEVSFGSADNTVSFPALPPSEEEFAPAAPEVVVRTPAPPPVPGLSPRSTVSRTTEPPSPSPSPSSPKTPPRTERVEEGEAARPTEPDQITTRPAPPRRATMTGRYRVTNSYGDAFIGEVMVTNTGSGDEGWKVRLVFPRGRLVTAWVDGTEQGRAGMDGGVFTYVGGVDLPPGGTAPLRFHIERTTTDHTPVSCTVNGAPCSGS